MSTDSAENGSDFRLASERLELAVGTVQTITDGGIDGVSMPLEYSFGLLRALAIDDLQYHQIIEASFERLSAFREAPIKWTHGRGMSGLTSHPGAVPAHVWSSAHEAAAALVDILVGAFFRPLGIEPTATDPVVRFPDFEDITDEQRETLGRLLSERGRKALAMTAEEVAEWTERIRHERARLLGQTALKMPLPPATPPEAASRLTVNLAKMTLTLDGVIEDVPSDLALRWVKVLAEHPDEWISGPKLQEYDSELTGVRTHTLREYLPKTVLALIDSETGKGSRLRLGSA